MNKPWLCSVILVSITLLSILKFQSTRTLIPYLRSVPGIKLRHFESAKSLVPKEDLQILKLWESILTGRSAPLSKMIKERYRLLGLTHLFTPSGFHLSALLFPFMKFLNKPIHRLSLFLTLGLGLFFLPGLHSLKRMLIVKTHQNLFGMKLGFSFAMLIDIFLGSFQQNPLSFSYSFLFLGIIYSGLKGVGIIVWFYFAQIILALFQGNDISPFLIIFSPLLNFGFSLALPLLLLLSFPLWEWQLQTGIIILKVLQKSVDALCVLCLQTPRFEVHIVTLLIIGCLLTRKWKAICIISILLSNSLNLDREKQPGLPANEYVPQGNIIQRIYEERQVKVIFSDGRCKLKLVRGFWWENCSPLKRRSNKRFI
jgi:hypothetical protein